MAFLCRYFAVLPALVVWAFAPASAQTADPVRAYVFGNSLIHHLSDSTDTNVPIWLSRMAKADGRTFALDGQWGFLRDFSRTFPPSANWSFPGVRGAWNPDRGNFGSAGFTSILINPANFIQYQAPDAPFDGGDGRASPVTETVAVFDWTNAQAPGLRYYIYEGWAEMAGIAGRFPPSDRGLRRYHAFNMGDYHAWYEAYRDAVQAERPDLDVQLIPVASLMSELLSSAPLSQIAATALYSDDAPHGTDTLYLLAAMITYAAVFQAEPPAIDMSDRIDPVLQNTYAQTAKRIWQSIEPSLVAAPQRPAIQKAQIEQPIVPLPKPKAPREQVVPVAAPTGGGQGPALGMGLNGIADWSTQHPFIDVMKTAREWIGHQPGQWGGFDANALRALGVLDENGWPLGLPDGATHLETFVLTDQPADALYLRGRYRVTFDGQGDLRVGGRAKRIQIGDGEIRFTYEPGDGLVSLALRDTDPNDPIRNIRIVREDHIALDEAGVIFNPEWIARIQDLRSIRFMDWMFTNGSPISRWNDRPRKTDYTYTAWGVPLDVMIALANQVGADPWFNIPHMADDNYVRNFAQTVRDGLDPRLKAYVEYSNEVWNFVFPQAHWASAQANARWGESETGWMQFYGMRSAEVMDIFSDVFGDTDRLVRVVATHTGWQGLEEAILLAPLAFLERRKHPKASFDAYAVTGYFGFELGEGENPAIVQGWIDQAEALSKAEGEAQGLRRVALREYVRKNGLSSAFGPLADLLEEGSLRELTDVIFPYQAAVARAHGLQLVMYEGGTHVAGHGEQTGDERLTNFYTEFNYTPEMARLYDILLRGWADAGGTLFNAFVDVAPPSQYGSWGALRHLDDTNPRWDVLMAFNNGDSANWEERDIAVFDDGVFLVGTDNADAIVGTAEEDILLAGGGDDLLDARGGSDHLHGGPGQDLAVLFGARNDYAFQSLGDLVLAKRGATIVHLRDIETVAFSSAPDSFVPVDELISAR